MEKGEEEAILVITSVWNESVCYSSAGDAAPAKCADFIFVI